VPACLQERIHRLTGIPEQFGEGLYGERPCVPASEPLPLYFGWEAAARCVIISQYSRLPPCSAPAAVLNYQNGQKYEA
jgi:hypothetical protein